MKNRVFGLTAYGSPRAVSLYVTLIVTLICYEQDLQAIKAQESTYMPALNPKP